MSSVTIDIAAIEQLRSQGRIVEVLLPAGHGAGYFIPADETVDSDRLEPRISREEIERRKQAGGRRSLDEIVRDWMRP